MRRGRERSGSASEGRILAVALGLVLLLALGMHLGRLLRFETVGPVHCVSEAAVERAGMTDLNRATVEELAKLPGIGEVLAGRIVAHRAEHGPFASVEALENVEGIGKGRLEKLRGWVFVD